MVGEGRISSHWKNDFCGCIMADLLGKVNRGGQARVKKEGHYSTMPEQKDAKFRDSPTQPVYSSCTKCIRKPHNNLYINQIFVTDGIAQGKITSRNPQWDSEHPKTYINEGCNQNKYYEYFCQKSVHFYYRNVYFRKRNLYFTRKMFFLQEQGLILLENLSFLKKKCFVDVQNKQKRKKKPEDDDLFKMFTKAANWDEPKHF